MRPLQTLLRVVSVAVGTSRVAVPAMVELMEPRRLLALPTLWTTEGPGGGGSLFAAAVNGDDLWVASDMSGIYRSGDFGRSWHQLNFHGGSGVGGMNGGTASQVQFTADPNVLYIPNSSIGVAKSNDGGATWSKLAGWTNGTAYWMDADETSTSRLLVANSSRLYISTNGGSSFTNVYTSPSGNLFVAGAFFDGSNVYVGTNKGLLVSTNGGGSFSVSGATGIAAGQYMTSFTGARSGGTTRLLAITSPTNPDPTNSVSARSYGFGKLYRLDVGGNWADRTSAITAVASGESPRFVQMARNNVDAVYVAGADAAGRPQVVKSVNGAGSFTDVFFTRPSDPGAGNVPNKNTSTAYSGHGGDFDWSWGGTPWSFVVSSSDPNRAMMANSGFIHVTDDGGASWRQAYSHPDDSNPAGQVTPKGQTYRSVGLEPTSVHYLTWTSPTNVFAAYTDITGWRSGDGGESWSYPQWNGVADNTTYNAVLAPSGKLYASASNVHDMYASNYLLDTRTNPTWQNGRVIVSSDHGASWSLVHEFGHPVVWVELDPNNPERMYAMVVDGISSPDGGAFGGVWVTSNLSAGAASTWTKLPNPPRTEGHPYYLRALSDGTLVATFSGRRFNDGTGEKFTASSGVFVSTDGGQTWVDRSHTNMRWYTKGITIDPTDPAQNTWYVAVANGWSGTGNDLGDVYRTTNRGQTWTKLGLQNVVGAISLSANSVTINPTTKEMYVATEVRGLLYTPDVTVPNLSWTHFADVTSFPHAWVERVFVNPYRPSEVWVATFGGGIRRGGVGPSALNATQVGPGAVTLSWLDNSFNETGFVVERATNSTFTQDVVTFAVAGDTSSTSVTGLAPNTTYYFRLRATAGLSASANSNTATVTTINPDPVMTGTSADDTFYVRRSGPILQVFGASTPTGAPVFSAPFATLNSLTINTLAGADSLFLDSSGGSPIPARGLFFNPGPDAGNSLHALGPTPGHLTLVDGTTVLAAPLLVDSLIVESAARLDVADQRLVVDSTGHELRQYLRSGAVFSSTGVASNLAVAYAALADLPADHPHAIHARSIGADETSVLTALAPRGDANLDGAVNADDRALFDRGRAMGGAGWTSGDFNHDNVIDVADEAFLNPPPTAASPAPAIAAVPAVATVGTRFTLKSPAKPDVRYTWRVYKFGRLVARVNGPTLRLVPVSAGKHRITLTSADKRGTVIATEELKVLVKPRPRRLTTIRH